MNFEALDKALENRHEKLAVQLFSEIFSDKLIKVLGGEDKFVHKAIPYAQAIKDLSRSKDIFSEMITKIPKEKLELARRVFDWSKTIDAWEVSENKVIESQEEIVLSPEQKRERRAKIIEIFSAEPAPSELYGDYILYDTNWKQIEAEIVLFGKRSWLTRKIKNSEYKINKNWDRKPSLSNGLIGLDMMHKDIFQWKRINDVSIAKNKKTVSKKPWEEKSVEEKSEKKKELEEKETQEELYTKVLEYIEIQWYFSWQEISKEFNKRDSSLSNAQLGIIWRKMKEEDIVKYDENFYWNHQRIPLVKNDFGHRWPEKKIMSGEKVKAETTVELKWEEESEVALETLEENTDFGYWGPQSTTLEFLHKDEELGIKDEEPKTEVATAKAGLESETVAEEEKKRVEEEEKRLWIAKIDDLKEKLVEPEEPLEEIEEESEESVVYDEILDEILDESEVVDKSLVLPLAHLTDKQIEDRYFTYDALRGSEVSGREFETKSWNISLMKSLTEAELEQFEFLAYEIHREFQDNMEELKIPVSSFWFDMTWVYWHLAKEQAYFKEINEQRDPETYPLRNVFDSTIQSKLSQDIKNTMLWWEIRGAHSSLVSLFDLSEANFFPEDIKSELIDLISIIENDEKSAHSYDYRYIWEQYKDYYQRWIMKNELISHVKQMWDEIKEKNPKYRKYHSKKLHNDWKVFANKRKLVEARNAWSASEISWFERLKKRVTSWFTSIFDWSLLLKNKSLRLFNERKISWLDSLIYEGTWWWIFDWKNHASTLLESDTATKLWFSSLNTKVHSKWGISFQYTLIWDSTPYHPQITSDHEDAFKFDSFLENLVDDPQLDTSQRLFLIKHFVESQANSLISQYGTLSTSDRRSRIDSISDQLVFVHEGATLEMSDIDDILLGTDENAKKDLMPILVHFYQQFWLMAQNKQSTYAEATKKVKNKDFVPQNFASGVKELRTKVGEIDKSKDIAWYRLPSPENETLWCYLIKQEGDSEYRVLDGEIYKMTPHREHTEFYYRSKKKIDIDDIGLNSPERLESYFTKTLTLFFEQYKDFQPHIATEHNGQLLELSWNYSSWATIVDVHYLQRNLAARTSDDDIMWSKRWTKWVQITPFRAQKKVSRRKFGINPVKNRIKRKGFVQDSPIYENADFDLNRFLVSSPKEKSAQFRDIAFVKKALQEMSLRNKNHYKKTMIKTQLTATKKDQKEIEKLLKEREVKYSELRRKEIAEAKKEAEEKKKIAEEASKERARINKLKVEEKARKKEEADRVKAKKVKEKTRAKEEADRVKAKKIREKTRAKEESDRVKAKKVREKAEAKARKS